MVKDGEKPRAEDIDVVTTGTCGIMSGTAAIFHLPVSEPGTFKKAKNILLNGIPGFAGPCPNEWLGSVDLMMYGTSQSIYDPQYGGGFLFEDLIKGKEIEIEVEDLEGNIIKSTAILDDFGTAQMIGIRFAFKIILHSLIQHQTPFHQYSTQLIWKVRLKEFHFQVVVNSTLYRMTLN